MNFNNEYAVVLIGGKAAILMEKPDGAFELMSKESFLLYLGPHDDQGKKWLTSTDRRTFDGIVFEPNRETRGQFNLWKGFPIQPVAGSCHEFLAHLRDNVCANNADHYRWLMAWFAHIFQHPDQKLETCVCIVGEEGTGKTFIADTFKHLMGRHAKVNSCIAAGPYGRLMVWSWLSPLLTQHSIGCLRSRAPFFSRGC